MTLYLNPRLRSLPAVLVFSGGMGIHTVLHWMFRFFSRDLRQAVIYFCFQSLLAAVLVLYSGEIGLVFGLYLALLGEEAGLFRSIKAVIVIVTVNVLLIVGTNFFRQNSTGIDLYFLAGLIPMILFVMIYVNLYSRQLEAKLEAQKLLKELEQTNVKLSMSNKRVEELTREKERQRIARELHDTLAQGLSGIILQLEAVTAYMEAGKQDKAANIIDKSMMKARETLAEARDVLDDLRSERPGGHSVRDFIYSEIEAFRHGSSINFTVDIGEVSLPGAAGQTQLEKIITEALGNCGEHSAADNVSLRLSDDDGGLLLEIVDDGRGFDSDKIEAGRYGLLGMKERAQILGGRLLIESFPGRGTRIELRIPEGAADEL